MFAILTILTFRWKAPSSTYLLGFKFPPKPITMDIAARKPPSNETINVKFDV